METATDDDAAALRAAVARTVGTPARGDLRYPGSVNWWPAYRIHLHTPGFGEYGTPGVDEFLPWAMQ